LNGPDDELTRLGRTLDDLFGRLEASFASQRRFVANASHELRTPLAGQRTLLEVALADPKASAAELRAACQEALALEEQQERLIGALFTLASSEGGVERRESVDLAAVAEQVVMLRADEAHGRHVRVQVSPGTAQVAGDPDLLVSLVANLVENGLRHNVDDGSLHVVTETPAGEAVVSVTNTGPMVSPEDVGRLFEPFRRAVDRTRTRDGHGLGLSIVRAVADAHQATVTVEPQTEGGLCVEIAFPSPMEQAK
jgi:signal transduction histidine kinase